MSDSTKSRIPENANYYQSLYGVPWYVLVFCKNCCKSSQLLNWKNVQAWCEECNDDHEHIECPICSSLIDTVRGGYWLSPSSNTSPIVAKPGFNVHSS